MKKIFANNFYMLKYIKKYCFSYFVVIIINTILQNLSSLLNIIFLKKIIDTISNSDSMIVLFRVVILMLLINLIYIIFTSWVNQINKPKNAQKLHAGMQLEIFNKASRVSYSIYETNIFYNDFILALEQSDSRALLVLDTFSKLIGGIFGISTFLILIGTLEPIIIVIIIINIIISIQFNTKISKKQNEFYETQIPLQRKLSYVEDIFYKQAYAKEIRLFPKLKDILISNFNQTTKINIEIIKKYGGKLTLLQSLQGIVNELSSVTILSYLAFKVINKLTSVSNFVMLTNSAQQLTSSITQLLMVFTELYEHSIYISGFRRFMDISFNVETKNKISITNFSILFKNVYFRYFKNEDYILKNINLMIPYGCKCAFVGENGAGKSTLLKLLINLLTPSEGDILVTDSNNKSHIYNNFNLDIGIIFQDFKLYAFSIAENILMRPFENKEKDENLVVEALKFVNLYEKVLALPEGIYTKITNEFTDCGYYFSGGEMQKIAIARLYIRNNKIIILDEPSSSLDCIAEEELIMNVFRYFSNRTIIIVSHKLSIMKYVEKIFYLEGGYIVEKGTHDDLIKKNGQYAKMYNLKL